MQDGRVIPLLLDLDFKEISGPLAQFQSKKADRNGLKELAVSLNKAADCPVSDQKLDTLFGALWTNLEGQISSIPNGTASAKHTRPQGEILEELVSSVRNVELRVRDVIDDDASSKRRRRSRMHPMMMMDMSRDMSMRLGDGPGDPIQLLIVASFLRDDVPWMYEFALEAYRAIKSGRRDEAREAYKRFSRSIDMLQKGPFFEEMGLDPRMLKMLSREVLPALEDMEMSSDFDEMTRARRLRVHVPAKKPE